MNIELLSAAMVAEQFGMTRTQVYAMARVGILPCIRLGRRIRFSSEQLQRFLEGGGRDLESSGQGHEKPPLGQGTVSAPLPHHDLTRPSRAPL
jgi:excisionase family DNA binding protein